MESRGTNATGAGAPQAPGAHFEMSNEDMALAAAAIGDDLDLRIDDPALDSSHLLAGETFSRDQDIAEILSYATVPNNVEIPLGISDENIKIALAT
ncbi:hypothetical protein THAOC_01336, partial [Thalassiosira oceanica]